MHYPLDHLKHIVIQAGHSACRLGQPLVGPAHLTIRACSSLSVQPIQLKLHIQDGLRSLGIAWLTFNLSL